MKCLVIGGAGFIGSNLVDELIRQGHDVRIIDDLSTGKKENVNPRAELFTVDITSNVAVDKSQKGFPSDSWNAFKDVDVVFHTAAKAEIWGTKKDFYSSNVEMTRNIINACLNISSKVSAKTSREIGFFLHTFSNFREYFL